MAQASSNSIGTRAVAKFIRVQPRKVRIIADEVRGRSAQQMVDVLKFHPSKGAFHLRKVIMSAIANAVENEGADPRTLAVTRVQVDEGPRLKRITARSMGRANRIVKKMSHITVFVGPAETQPAEEAPKAKVKERRTLKAPKKSRQAAPKTESAKADEPVVSQTEAPEQPDAQNQAEDSK